MHYATKVHTVSHCQIPQSFNPIPEVELTVAKWIYKFKTMNMCVHTLYVPYLVPTGDNSVTSSFTFHSGKCIVYATL